MHYVSATAAPTNAVPVNAVIVSSSYDHAGPSAASHYAEATVVEATPVHDADDTENIHTMKSIEGLSFSIVAMSVVYFILGCATMNYLGFGAGAWYAALFQFFSAAVILFGTKAESCNLRNMVVCSLVVTIIAIILTFIGMLADFGTCVRLSPPSVSFHQIICSSSVLHSRHIAHSLTHLPIHTLAHSVDGIRKSHGHV